MDDEMMWMLTRVEDQNFRIMSCQQVVSFEKGDAVFSESDIQQLIEPLKEENHGEAFVQSVELRLRDFLSDLVKQEDGIKHMDFTSEDNKEYKILCHKFNPVVFGFLLYPLSASDMQKIERDAVGKMYLTGDMADMFKKKEDFN